MTAPAVRSGRRVRTLSEVKERAARLAAGLAELGVGHGDRYGVVMRNETAFIEASLAASLIGAVPVPANWHWHGADLQHLLRDSNPKAVLVHSDLLPAVRSQVPTGSVTIVEAEVPEEVCDAYGLNRTPLTGQYASLQAMIEQHDAVVAPNAEPVMGVIYTSGTTRLAKGILRNPVPTADMPRLLEAMRALLKLAPGGRTVITAPLYHAAPNNNALFAVALGMDVTIMPKFDPLEFLRIVQEHRIDTVQMVPTMFRRLLQLPRPVRDSYDVSSLRAIVHAAAPCPPEVKEAMIDWFGPIVYEYYGCSEAGPWAMCDSADALSHPGTVGKPFFGADVHILDAAGEQAPSGVAGLIYGKPFDGWPDFTYIGNDEKRREMERGGYLTAGDIGYVDADGFLYLTDRINDMVISGGVNIYPAEIEACLLQLDGVADVAVFGIPDEDFGEALAAHVQVLPGAQLAEDDIRAFVAANLAKYKVPRIVIFDDELPREDTGKLFKRKLKALYWPKPEPR
jgi:long-chain acyl-CoA synthetase